MNNKYELILMGDGYQKLSTGALYAKKGKKVLILENTEDDCLVGRSDELPDYAYAFHDAPELISIIENNGGKIINTPHVNQICFDEQNTVSVVCANGSEYYSNILVRS